jgi:hypothetical protein
MMFSDQLRLLARLYIAKKGDSLHALGMKVGKQKLFTRLFDGKSFYAESGEDALLWFSANWPDDVPWPRSVGRPAVPDPPEAAKSIAASSGDAGCPPV